MGFHLPFPECESGLSTILYAWGLMRVTFESGGMIAPLLGGILLTLDRSFPVYTSVVIFGIAGVCVLLLDEYGGDGDRAKSERALVH